MSDALSNQLIDDLDAMFCAVKTRLRHIGEGSVEPPAATAIEANDRLCRGVLECVSALDQLHVMLAQEVDRRHVLELFVSDAQAALARVPPELAPVIGLPLRMPPIGGLFKRATTAASA
jgi:hypothetical protein